jgi:hypothetical protein
VLTNSQMRCFRRCPREHLYSYVQGYRSTYEAEALRFGTLLHSALEAWWSADDDAVKLEAAIEAMRPLVADEYDLVRAGVLMQGYDARWANERLDVIAVEAEFRAPLINPETGAASRTFELGGKLDVVVRDRRDGLVKLVEHKTTSEEIGPGSDYWKRLVIDPQISTYFAGGKAYGYEIAECIYDVIGKPGLRPSAVPLTDELGNKIVLDANGERVRTKQGKWRQTGDAAEGYVLQTRPETPDEFRERLTAHIAENPERYYQRDKVVRLEAEELDAAHDAWATARLIREAELANRWPRNPDACVRYGRTCSYFGVCTGTASLDDITLFRRTDNVHEELSSEAA